LIKRNESKILINQFRKYAEAIGKLKSDFNNEIKTDFGTEHLLDLSDNIDYLIRALDELDDKDLENYNKKYDLLMKIYNRGRNDAYMDALEINAILFERLEQSLEEDIIYN